MLLSNPQSRFFCVAMLLLALLAGVGGEWYFSKANHLYQARIQELTHFQSALYQQIADSGWVRTDLDKALDLLHDSTTGSDNCTPSSTLMYSIRRLQRQINSLPIFCTDQLMAKQAGNSCNRWRLAMLFHRCGPPGYNLLRGQFFAHTIYPLGSEIVPIQSISMSWINTHERNDSIVFCLPRATGGTMDIVAK